MTKKDLTDERGQFIKGVIDDMFKKHPELINKGEETQSWLYKSAGNNTIKSYEDKIIDKFGDDCLITTTVGCARSIPGINYGTIRGFNYDTWSYIETALEPYGYVIL